MAALDSLKLESGTYQPSHSSYCSSDYPDYPDTRTASPGPEENSYSETTVQAVAFPQPSALLSDRNARSESLAFNPNPIIAKPPIRRKPLSSTVSPLPVKYTSSDYLEITQDIGKPETRFSRPFSVDSPTFYEFPDRCSSVVGSSHSVAHPSSPHPSKS